MPKIKKQIYPYSTDKFLNKSFKNFLHHETIFNSEYRKFLIKVGTYYDLVRYTDKFASNVYGFLPNVYKLGLFNFIYLYKILSEPIIIFRENIKLLDIKFKDMYFTLNTFNINNNQESFSFHLLSSSYISIKYLFNFTKKEFLYTISKEELKNLFKPAFVSNELKRLEAKNPSRKYFTNIENEKYKKFFQILELY